MSPSPRPAPDLTISLNVSHVLSVFAFFWTTYVVGVCIYRTWFHPLSKYPGPFLAKITSARGAFYGAIGDHHLDVTELHKTYGNLVRYGPNRLLVKSTRGLNDIYGFGKPVKKAQSYAPMVQGKDGFSTPTCIDKKMHRNMRDKLMRGLSPDNIQAFEPAVHEKVDKFVDLLQVGSIDTTKDKWTATKDMNAHNKWLAFDSIAELGFGQRLGLLDDPKLRFISDVFEWCTFRIGFYEHWPTLASLGIENVLGMCAGPSTIVKNFMAWRDTFAKAATDKHGNAKRGIFSHISQGQNVKAGQVYSKPQLLAEGTTLLIVGGDTTAATLSALMFYLPRSPHAYAKLAEEVRSTFSSYDEIVSGPALGSCAYLQACINESLRITPAGPGTLWRETEAEHTIIDGEVLPKGVDVGSCIYSMHRDPAIYRNYAQFWPERWIPGVLPEPELAAAKAAFKPFSLGPRACPGRSIAMMEMTIAIARLLYKTDFKVAKGDLGRIGQGHPSARRGRTDINEFQIETRFTAASHGPYLQFKQRSNI